MSGIAVAIDGPAGAGKSTVSKALAAATGYALLDTGAMYRAATVVCMRTDSLNSDEEISRAIADNEIRIEISQGKTRAFVDADEITEHLRDKDVTKLVSRVSAVKSVRDWAVSVQRSVVDAELAKGNGIILEGRDIGTTVLPDAKVKFFLTASDQKRAERRALEVSASPEVILAEIQHRDQQDSGREISPLRKADDALEIDASDLSVEDVVNVMLDVVKQS